MLENKKTTVGGIHYSRYIESWRNVGGFCDRGEYFDEWLKSEGLTDEEIHDIHELCICAGKFELEQSAKPFAEKQNKETEEMLNEVLKEIENDDSSIKKQKAKRFRFFKK